jgi:hypothetical protein
MQLSVSRPGRFTLREEVQGTHWIGNWVDPRADLDSRGMENNILILPGIKLRFLGRPAHTLSPYRLSYPGYDHQTRVLTKISLEDVKESKNLGVTCYSFTQ